MKVAWWVGAGAAVALATVVACSYLPSGTMDKAVDKAKGMMGNDNPTSSPPQAQQPAQQPAQGPTVIVVQPPAARGPAGPPGMMGGMGGMPPECQDMGTTREGTSACYQKLAAQMQMVSDQCGKRAASGMDVQHQKDNEKCRDQLAAHAKAATCVSEDIMKPGTQLQDVTKACNARFGAGQ